MFTALHALAKDATLLITAQAEGDQLRVSVTPTYPGGKVPAGVTPLRPLSVLGTPAEFDTDFATALTIWRAPKKSLIEQAQATADDDTDGAPAKPTAKPAAKTADAKPKGTPGRKKTAAAGGAADADDKEKDSEKDKGEQDTGAAAPGGAPAAGVVETPAEVAPVSVVPAAVEPAPEPAADPAADVHTLDLF